MNLREQLQVIYEDHGRLTPAIVVDEARDKAHPLHSRFEWDNKIAGEAWRQEQASALIRSVRVVYRKPDSDKRIEVRSWHSIAGPDGHTYEPTEKVTGDPVLRAIVLRDMEREWRELHGRYSDFEEFLTMVRADLEATA